MIVVKKMDDADRFTNGRGCRGCGKDAEFLVSAQNEERQPVYVSTICLCPMCFDEVRSGTQKAYSANREGE